MRVRIDDQVFVSLDKFYDEAMCLHESLSFENVLAKEKRMIADLHQLANCAESMLPAKYIFAWKREGYLDYVTEGFHFGFKIETLPSGEKVAVVYDACPDLLFHD